MQLSSSSSDLDATTADNFKASSGICSAYESCEDLPSKTAEEYSAYFNSKPCISFSEKSYPEPSHWFGAIAKLVPNILHEESSLTVIENEYDQTFQTLKAEIMRLKEKSDEFEQNYKYFKNLYEVELETNSAKEIKLNQQQVELKATLLSYKEKETTQNDNFAQLQNECTKYRENYETERIKHKELEEKFRAYQENVTEKFLKLDKNQKETDKEIYQLQEEIKEKTFELDSQHKLFDEEKNLILEQLNMKSEEIMSQTELIKSLKKRVTDFEEKHKIIKQKFTDHTKAMQEALKKLKVSEQNLEIQTKEVSSLRDICQTQIVTIQDSEEKYNKLKNNMTTMEKQHNLNEASLKEQNKILATRYKNIESRHEKESQENRQKSEDSEQKLANFLMMIRKKESELSSLQSKVIMLSSQLEEKYACHTSELMWASSSAAFMKKQHLADISLMESYWKNEISKFNHSISKNIEEKSSKFELIDMKCKQLKSSMHIFIAKNQKLEDKCYKQMMQVDRLNNLIKEKEIEIKATSTKLNEKIETILRLETYQDNLTQTLTVSKEDNKKLLKERNELEEAFSQNMAMFKNLQNCNSLLKNEIMNLNSSQSILQESKNKLEYANEQFRAELDSIKESCATCLKSSDLLIASLIKTNDDHLLLLNENQGKSVKICQLQDIIELQGCAINRIANKLGVKANNATTLTPMLDRWEILYSGIEDKLSIIMKDLEFVESLKNNVRQEINIIIKQKDALEIKNHELNEQKKVLAKLNYEQKCFIFQSEKIIHSWVPQGNNAQGENSLASIAADTRNHCHTFIPSHGVSDVSLTKNILKQEYAKSRGMALSNSVTKKSKKRNFTAIFSSSSLASFPEWGVSKKSQEALEEKDVDIEDGTIEATYHQENSFLKSRLRMFISQNNMELKMNLEVMELLISGLESWLGLSKTGNIRNRIVRIDSYIRDLISNREHKIAQLQIHIERLVSFYNGNQEELERELGRQENVIESLIKSKYL